ncbi:hypothetical protein EV1_033958 [Malus domestica]
MQRQWCSKHGKKAATRRSFKAHYSNKETKMLRNPAVVTQAVSCTAQRRHHQWENCDQKALHSEAPLQSLAQHHTIAHHQGKTVIKRHYTAKPRCSLWHKH